MQSLSGFDAWFIYDEGRYETQHTLKVCFLGDEASRAYDFEATKTCVQARLAILPLLRWRAERIPFDLHHPVWVEDGALDLDYHVRRRRLPDGAGREELCQAISEITSEPLDPARPLWQSWFLEGYEGDKIVVAMKVSHALADGGSFVELFERALFTSPEDADAFRKHHTAVGESAAPVVERPGRAKLFLLGLSRLARDILIRTPKLAYNTLRARMRLRKARDLVARPTMNEAPHHAWEGPLGPRRAFYFTTVPLAAAKQIDKTFDVSINDVAIVVAAGAVRRYLERRELLPDTPVVGIMAASIRRPEQRGQWGNRVTTRALRMPTHLADPVERLRYAHDEATEAKRDIALRSGAHSEEWIGLAPPFMVKALSWMWRSATKRMRPGGAVVVSNIRGPTSTLYTSNGPVDNIVSVGNLKNLVALSITVWSYVDKLNFGLYTDGQAFPDLSEVADHIDAAFAELADAAECHHSGS